MEVLNIMHVNVVCSDLDRSLHFYEGLLGAKVHQYVDDAETDLRPTLGIGPEGPEEFRAALLYWGRREVVPTAICWSGRGRRSRRTHNDRRWEPRISAS